MLERLANAIRRLQRFVDHVWYPPLLGLMCILDLFILVVPLDGLMISSVLLRPRRWASIFLCMTGGAMLGAFVVGCLIQVSPALVQNGPFQSALHSAAWLRTQSLVHRWGIGGLFVLGMSPIPQQFPVLVAGLAGLSPLTLALALGAGRFFKYGAYGWITAHAPHWLARIPLLREQMRKLEAVEHETTADPDDQADRHRRPRTV
jgi:membrane protein YqaA with SNARE-associated domain